MCKVEGDTCSITNCNLHGIDLLLFFFFFQAEDGIRDYKVTGVQTCALPILGIDERQRDLCAGAQHLIAAPKDGSKDPLATKFGARGRVDALPGERALD